MNTRPTFLTYSLWAFFVLAFACVTAACQSPTPMVTPTWTAVPTDTATPEPTPTATATATVTPRSTDTPLPTPTPTTTDTPTLTPKPTLSTAGYEQFVQDDLGLSIYYPAQWDNYPPDEEEGGVQAIFYSTNGSIVAYLIANQLSAADYIDLASANSDLVEAVLEDFDEIAFDVDDAVTLANGRPAWSTVVSAKNSSGEALKINFTTIQRDFRMASLIVFGDTTNYNIQEKMIAFMANTLDFDPGMVYDLPREQVLMLSGGESTNPREYDPATLHSSGDKLIFSGLVAFDPQLQLVPDLAESWEITDGTVYTFKLRQNAKFHDGRPVTAQDFIYAWERAANPATESDTVLTYLGDIVGVKEMRAGEADQIAGLKALDDHTLQVTIDAPKPYFLFKLTFPTAFVLDQQNVESGPEWYRTPNGTGPYKLTRWDSFEVMIYERNEAYYLELPQIPYVITMLFSGVDIRMYEAGYIDVAGVPYYDVERLNDPAEPLNAELHTQTGLCTSYVTFDVNQPPFDDIKVRQAFSLAFDRELYNKTVLQGSAIPATGLYPPSLPGYNPELVGLSYDPEQARRLLSESRYSGPEGLPPIVFTDSGFGSDASLEVSAMAQMWQQNLGVTITIENLEPNRYQDEINAGHHGQMLSAGWCADYPDPENFADVLFHTGAEQNNGNYSNPELDAILEQARGESDVQKRIELYQQAEAIIVNDAPALFTTYSVQRVLVKPYLLGYVLTPISIPLERYLNIDVNLFP